MVLLRLVVEVMIWSAGSAGERSSEEPRRSFGDRESLAKLKPQLFTLQQQVRLYWRHVLIIDLSAAKYSKCEMVLLESNVLISKSLAHYAWAV